ncbi:MAG: MFS transporter [Candidatus Abawacabacteria bacterium]|nr:MFS transporter [Candidatus Abawacabacteria bacterium]
MKWFNFFIWFRPYSPIAILYFASITGSLASALLVFSIFSLSTCLFEIPTGVYSDRIGRRKTLILGSLASLLSIICYAIGSSFFILILGAVLAGLQDALFSGNNDALLYDTLGETKEEMHFQEHSGKISATLQIALGLSALLGGIVANFSFAWVFWLSVLPQLLALIISFRIKEPQTINKAQTSNIFAHLKESFHAFLTNSKLRKLSLSSILRFSMGETQNQFMPAFLSTVWPLWSLGVAKAMNKFFSFLGSRYAGSIVSKFSTFRVLLIGEIIGIIFIVLAVIFPTIISPLLIAITAFFFGIAGVALSSLMQIEFTNEQRATMGSINSLFSNTFFAVFAYIFGLIADHLGVIEPIIITQVLMLIVAYIYWNLFKSHEKQALIAK